MGKIRIQLTEISKSYYSKAAVTQALHKISLTFSSQFRVPMYFARLNRCTQKGVSLLFLLFLFVRMVTIGICAAGLLVLAFTSILILSSLMRLRRKDFVVLKFMGMQTKLLDRIGYYELGAHSVTAIVGTVIVMWILRSSGIQVFDFNNMMWYMRWHAYVLVILYNLAVCVFAVALFNRFLRNYLRTAV